MPSFTFAAVDDAGKVVSGVRAAATRQEVISRLRAENLVVTSVAEESATAIRGTIARKDGRSGEWAVARAERRGEIKVIMNYSFCVRGVRDNGF